MATTARNRRLEPCYKQHTAVDDGRGVVLDVEATTGEANEGETIESQVDEVRQISGNEIEAVTADAVGLMARSMAGSLEGACLSKGRVHGEAQDLARARAQFDAASPT